MKLVEKDVHDCPQCGVLAHCGKKEIKQFELKTTRNINIIESYLRIEGIIDVYHNRHYMYEFQHGIPILDEKKIRYFIDKSKKEPFFCGADDCFYKFCQPSKNQMEKLIKILSIYIINKTRHAIMFED